MFQYSKQFFALALVILGVFLAAGCATIIHGTSQDFGISSEPTGALVTVDNQPSGNTPIVAKLSRKDNHTVKVALDGYLPYEINVTHSTNGWVWGNIVFGGLIGLAVDAISGGMYELDQNQLKAELKKSTASVTPTENGVYIVTVLRPDPSWHKIASLQQAK